MLACMDGRASPTFRMKLNSELRYKISQKWVTSRKSMYGTNKASTTRLPSDLPHSALTMDLDVSFHLQQIQEDNEDDYDDQIQLAGTACAVILLGADSERRKPSRLYGKDGGGGRPCRI
ncbi:hypothetical protein DFH09DRAFT_1289173 [Mycena vulgaris]|nr:hypothetical protein DFH09DRAFT_1289173 [Mycena vulgaris]